MDTYKENEPNRKQAMIPLIALLICFLAITGVGVAYAYNQSTIQIDDNPVNEQYYTLDYTNDEGGMIATVLPASAEDMTIITSLVTNGVRDYTATIQSGSFTREFYVNLDHNMNANQKFVIAGEVITNDSVITAIFGDCTFAMKGGNGFADAVDMDEVGKGVYKVILTVNVNEVDVSTLTELDGADEIEDATTLANALADLDNHKFSVKLTATPVAPATP